MHGGIVAVVNEVLISFFDSKQAALSGLELVDGIGREHDWRSQAVVVSRETDESLPRCDPPIPWPFGAIVGLCLGGIVGSLAGEAGLVIGLFFGLYLGIFVDAWRALGRGDLLDEIQYGLEPGQAALVSFVPRWSVARIEHDLASLDSVTVHRFPGTPLDDDLTREAAEAVAEARGLLGAERDYSSRRDAEHERPIGAAGQRLRTIDAIADRLLWQQQVQFEADVHILSREAHGAGGWRTARIGRRIQQVRASHQRSRMVLNASRLRVRAAAAAVQADSARGAQVDPDLGTERLSSTQAHRSARAANRSDRTMTIQPGHSDASVDVTQPVEGRAVR